METSFITKILPWVIGTFIATMGLFYTAMQYREETKPFEPEFSIGNWLMISTTGTDDAVLPGMVISLDIKNHGKRIGTVKNVALQVKYQNLTAQRSYIFKAVREVESIEAKSEAKPYALKTIDVFHPFTVKSGEEVRKIYAFILEGEIKNLLDKPMLDLIVWAQFDKNKDWINVASAKVIDNRNVWNTYYKEKRDSWVILEIEGSKEEYTKLTKKTESS